MRRTPRKLEIVSGTWNYGARKLKKGDTIFTSANIPKDVVVKEAQAKPSPRTKCEVPETGMNDPEKLVYRHKGGGRWEVVNAVTDKRVHEGWLKKAEAKALAEG